MTTPDVALPVQPEAEQPPAVSSLSPSRASDFMTCPLLYRFRVLDRLPEPPSHAAARGTVVHAVLERLFDLPAAERTPQAAAAMLEPEWERLIADEPELAELFGPEAEPGALAEWLAQGRELLERYFTLEDPGRIEPRDRELFVESMLDDGELSLRGYVDRLDVSPAGEMRIVDYKSGRAPREGFEARAMFQMRFYALVLWRLHGRVPRLLKLLYLGSGESLAYTPDEADLRATERKLRALWDAISRAERTGDFRPHRSRLCDWCAHQSICPEFGGTPPPLPATATASGERSAGDAFEAPSPRDAGPDV